MEVFQAWAAEVSLWQALVWVAGAVGLVLFVFKGWPAIRKFAAAMSKFVRVVDSINGLPEFMTSTTATLEQQDVTLAKQDKKIAEIHHEVHFNNGSSVKDAVIRVEVDVKKLLEDK